MRWSLTAAATDAAAIVRIVGTIDCGDYRKSIHYVHVQSSQQLWANYTTTEIVLVNIHDGHAAATQRWRLHDRRTVLNELHCFVMRWKSLEGRDYY